jgi:hypothetical protein
MGSQFSALDFENWDLGLQAYCSGFTIGGRVQGAGFMDRV